ncbi:MAG: zinc-ribbon domain-containing protein, partial [Rhodospirillaceae bacterium]
MRITCPNCTAGFEIPTALLGKKGRSLKCATCSHAWFQTAVVDEIDLAEVLAQAPAAEVGGSKGWPRGKQQGQAPAKAETSGAKRQASAVGAPPATKPLGRVPNAQTAQMGQGPKRVPKHDVPPKELPRGAKSIMRKRAQGAGNLATGDPGASLRGQLGPKVPGDEAFSWSRVEHENKTPIEQTILTGPAPASTPSYKVRSLDKTVTPNASDLGAPPQVMAGKIKAGAAGGRGVSGGAPQAPQRVAPDSPGPQNLSSGASQKARLGAAMSQLAGDNAGPGEGAQSLSGGESGGPGDGAPMSGAAGGPGGAAMSQLAGDNAGPGEG